MPIVPSQSQFTGLGIYRVVRKSWKEMAVLSK